MLGLLLSLMMVLAASAAGFKLSSRFTEGLSGWEKAAFGGALGLGLFAYAIFLLGMLGLFAPLPFAVLSLLVAGFALFRFPKLAPSQTEKTKRELIPADGVFWGGLLLYAVLTLIAVLAPATSNEWDSIAYHLAVPKLFLQAGRIYPIDYIHHSNFPSLTEMLFGWGLAFGGQSGAKFFHWAFSVLMFLGVGGFALRHHSKTARSFAVLALAFTPMLFWEAGTAYVDIATGCYSGLSALAAYEAIQTRDQKRVWLAAIMAGFAIGTKTTALLMLGVLSVLVFAYFLRAQKGAAIRATLTLFLIGALIASPWFAKTAIYTGNPVYPFFYSVFGGRNWNAENARQYTEEQNSFGVGDTLQERRSIGALLSAPFNLIAYAPNREGAESENAYVGRGFTNKGTPLALIGGVWSAFLLSLPFLKRPRFTAFALLFSGGLILGWFFTSQQSRYLFMVLPPLAALLGWCVADEKKWVRWGIGLMIALQAASLLFIYVPAFTQSQALAVFGGLNEQEYLSRVEPGLANATAFVNQLPPASKVLLIDEVRGYYFERSYVWGNPGHHTLIPYSRFQTPEQLIEFLRSQGYTHVLFNLSVVSPSLIAAESWRGLFSGAIQQNLLHSIYDQQGFLIASL